jgi:O-antigen ligase
MILALVGLGLVCALVLAARFPAAATVLWILVLETSPDAWLDKITGGYETIIGAMKAAGLVLAVVMGLRFGARSDRYNPSFAFAAMFGTGLVHGLYPGLSLADSVRSLLGSAVPFSFSFIKVPAHWVRAVVGAAIFGPLVTVGFGLVLAAAGISSMYDFEQGAMRLGASGEPPFLGGFALIAIYAGLMEFCSVGVRTRLSLMLPVNFVILLLTGARAPLAIAVVLTIAVLVAQRRIVALAVVGALGSIVVLFAGQLNFIRVIDLVQLGEAGSLSNRDLVWPHFTAAIAASPWVGWGVGAGKVVVPLNSSLLQIIGTNAAHDEYLRVGAEGGFLGLALLIVLMALWVVRGSRKLERGQRWLMRAIFVAFAVHSATDNTLIATTSSVFFVWVSAIFATAGEARKAAP